MTIKDIDLSSLTAQQRDFVISRIGTKSPPVMPESWWLSWMDCGRVLVRKLRVLGLVSGDPVPKTYESWVGKWVMLKYNIECGGFFLRGKQMCRLLSMNVHNGRATIEWDICGCCNRGIQGVVRLSELLYIGENVKELAAPLTGSAETEIKS